MTPTSDQPQITPDEFEDGLHWLRTQTGFPSFEDFKKNPEKWRRRPEEMFEAIDKSTELFGNRLKTERLFWKDKYRLESLGQLRRVLKEEGYEVQQTVEVPIARLSDGTSAGGNVEMDIQLWPIHEHRLKGGIIAND